MKTLVVYEDAAGQLHRTRKDAVIGETAALLKERFLYMDGPMADEIAFWIVANHSTTDRLIKGRQGADMIAADREEPISGG